jgi:hypothetical protein
MVKILAGKTDIFGGMVLKRFLLIVFFLLILIIGLISLRFGSAVFQERNPTPILTSIMNLELSKSNYEQFSESNMRNRYVSANTGNSRYDVVKEFMKEKGWDFKEQIGSGLVFGKNEKTLVVETRKYSRHYILWDIPNEAFWSNSRFKSTESRLSDIFCSTPMKI